MTTDVIVNGNPRIRFEKLMRYMPNLLRKTLPVEYAAGVAGSLTKGRAPRKASLTS
jgi:hypothetical protein